MEARAHKANLEAKAKQHAKEAAAKEIAEQVWQPRLGRVMLSRSCPT